MLWTEVRSSTPQPSLKVAFMELRRRLIFRTDSSLSSWFRALQVSNAPWMSQWSAVKAGIM